MEQDHSWNYLLARNSRGEVLSTMTNIGIILRYDENLKNIVFNEMRKSIDITGRVSWHRTPGYWNHTDFSCLMLYLEKTYHIYAPG